MVSTPAQREDNRDIENYMGNFDVRYQTKIENHGIQVMFRNNLKTDVEENKGALELGYTYPFNNRMNIYVQYFYGYGESLIDYNFRQQSISIGFETNHWLDRP